MVPSVDVAPPCSVEDLDSQLPWDGSREGLCSVPLPGSRDEGKWAVVIGLVDANDVRGWAGRCDGFPPGRDTLLFAAVVRPVGEIDTRVNSPSYCLAMATDWVDSFFL